MRELSSWNTFFSLFFFFHFDNPRVSHCQSIVIARDPLPGRHIFRFIFFFQNVGGKRKKIEKGGRIKKNHLKLVSRDVHLCASVPSLGPFSLNVYRSRFILFFWWKNKTSQQTVNFRVAITTPFPFPTRFGFRPKMWSRQSVGVIKINVTGRANTCDFSRASLSIVHSLFIVYTRRMFPKHSTQNKKEGKNSRLGTLKNININKNHLSNTKFFRKRTSPTS